MEKNLKKAIRDRQKRLKPKECQKYVRIVIDTHILSTCGANFFTELTSATGEIKYLVRSLLVKDCILWERRKSQLELKSEEENGETEVWSMEHQVVKILTHPELVQMVKSGTLHTIADSFNKYYANMQHIVLFIRNNEKLTPAISSSLIELQIMHELKILQVGPSTKELVNQIKCLTKSIAQIPYKMQLSEIQGSFKKFLANDKKQCVRVEGSNGFTRLWQQHLNRLPLVTLEIAETLICKYSCPKKLIHDLKNNPNAIKEISELKIRRSGPVALQTDRRIGKVLSNKIYTLYNSTDPTTLF